MDLEVQEDQEDRVVLGGREVQSPEVPVNRRSQQLFRRSLFPPHLSDQQLRLRDLEPQHRPVKFATQSWILFWLLTPFLSFEGDFPL